VNVTVEDPAGSQWVSFLVQLAPIAVLLALFLFMMRQMQSGGNKALSFWQEPGSFAQHAAEEDYVQGRGGC